MLLIQLAAIEALAQSTGTTPPAPPDIAWDSIGRREDGGTITLIFEGYASGLGSVDLFEGQEKVGTSATDEQDCPSGCFYIWTIVVEGVSEGTHTYYATYTDPEGNVSQPSEPYTKENLVIPPFVTSTAPENGATAVNRETNVVANFSEQMDTATLTKENFKLYRRTVDGYRRITDVTVTPSLDGKEATLNPYGSSEKLLAGGTRYKAVVTTSALDLAGNGLDEYLCMQFQYSWCEGLQPKKWTFKTTT